MASIGHGEAEKECGGGGPGPARWFVGRQGAGQEADGEAAGTKRAEGGGGAVGEEKKVKKVVAYA